MDLAFSRGCDRVDHLCLAYKIPLSVRRPTSAAAGSLARLERGVDRAVLLWRDDGYAKLSGGAR